MRFPIKNVLWLLPAIFEFQFARQMSTGAQESYAALTEFDTEYDIENGMPPTVVSSLQTLGWASTVYMYLMWIVLVLKATLSIANSIPALQRDRNHGEPWQVYAIFVISLISFFVAKIQHAAINSSLNACSNELESEQTPHGMKLQLGKLGLILVDMFYFPRCSYVMSSVFTMYYGYKVMRAIFPSENRNLLMRGVDGQSGNQQLVIVPVQS